MPTSNAAQRLRELIGKATKAGEWGIVASSHGGLIVTRRADAPIQDRHPQSHIQIVPEADARLIVALANVAPLIAAVLEPLRLITSAECRECRGERPDHAPDCAIGALEIALSKELSDGK